MITKLSDFQKSQKVNESSHDDFVDTYGTDISKAYYEHRKIGKALRKAGENEIVEMETLINSTLKPYDVNLESFIVGRDIYDKSEIVRIALANQNTYGTEPRMVLLAIEDVYNALVRNNFIVPPEEKTNEATIATQSYYFSGEPSTSAHIESRAGRFSIWLNGGNAFRFDNVSPELLKKLDESGKSKEVEHKIMELIVSTMVDNIEKIMTDTVN